MLAEGVADIVRLAVLVGVLLGVPEEDGVPVIVCEEEAVLELVSEGAAPGESDCEELGVPELVVDADGVLEGLAGTTMPLMTTLSKRN